VVEQSEMSVSAVNWLWCLCGSTWSIYSWLARRKTSSHFQEIFWFSVWIAVAMRDSYLLHQENQLPLVNIVGLNVF